MLPRAHRLRASSDFTEVVRRGRRAARPLLTVHALPVQAAADASDPADEPVRVGLVVGKAVGGSVVRHRTARRLRHLMQDRLVALPPGLRVVVRAAPGAGDAPSVALAADLDAALERLARPRSTR